MECHRDEACEHELFWDKTQSQMPRNKYGSMRASGRTSAATQPQLSRTSAAPQPQREGHAERAGKSGNPCGPPGLRVEAKRICTEQLLGSCLVRGL